MCANTMSYTVRDKIIEYIYFFREWATMEAISETGFDFYYLVMTFHRKYHTSDPFGCYVAIDDFFNENRVRVIAHLEGYSILWSVIQTLT